MKLEMNFKKYLKMNQNRKLIWGAVLVAILFFSAFLGIPSKIRTDDQTRVSLTLVPPTPVTNKIKLDIKGCDME